ncbi:MAG TPA: AAA family ATPase [Ilumatobacter sp.]|nr:AAA family ATPase [Ilumatobacter sp.]
MDTARTLVGRQLERDVLVEALDRAGSTSCAVVVHGPPGIGKTSLLLDAAAAAGGRGFDVVTARPTRAESPLAFAALADLLRGADLAVLPDAEREAVEIALGRRGNIGMPPHAHELGFAVVDLLAARAERGTPVAIVVDDIQWIDAATREVLTFAARRLPAAGVCVLLGERAAPDGADSSDPLDIPEAIRLAVGPLTAPAIAALLDRPGGDVLPTDVVDRIVATAGGNPYYAIELARAARAAPVRPGRPLTLPRSLTDAVSGRLAELPPVTREALAVVAMLARPTPATLEAVDLLAELLPAESAGVVNVVGDRIEFSHPLLAAAAHDAVPGSRRIGLHRRLATVTDGIERCIHLALGAVEPDPAIADELAAGATAALARGATATAAELAVLALDTAPDEPTRWRRRLLAADMLFRSGRTDEAAAEIDAVLAGPPDRATRTPALLALATIEYSRTDNGDTAAELAREALAIAPDHDLRADAHTLLARVLYDDFRAAAHHAEQALTLIRRRPAADRLALAAAIQASAGTRFMAGEGLDREAFEEAIELERGSNVPPADSAFGSLAALLKYADELDESRVMLESLVERADAGSLPYALSHLPQLHLWAGRWDAAEECAQRHLWLAEHTVQESQVYAARFNLATVAANRGELDDAERIGRQLADDGRAGNVPWTERNGAALLGFVAMSRGDAVAATEHLGRYDELGERMHLLDPGYGRLLGDYLEALVATSRLDVAAAVVARLGHRADQLERPSARAVAWRGQALLAATAGQHEHALAAARAALTALDGTALVYERARAQLTLGVVARRLKERGVAREALGAALDAFDTMGAASLSARARHELDRVGGRTDATVGLDALTATEASVAELAAQGATTRQIAGTLFISAKTVEANLTRIYRRLGIANRAQLAQALAGRRVDT